MAKNLLNNVLHLPSQNSSGNRLKDLLEVRNNDGKTALEIAHSYGQSHKQVQKVIQEYETKAGVRSVPIPPIEEELLFQLRLLQTQVLKGLTREVAENSLLKFEDCDASAAPSSRAEASVALLLNFTELGGKPALQQDSTKYGANMRPKALVSIQMIDKIGLAIFNALLTSPFGSQVLFEHRDCMKLLLRLVLEISEDGTESIALLY